MESIPDAGSKVWLQFCVFAIEIAFKTLCMLQIQPAFILFFFYLLCFSLANINWCWTADTLLQHGLLHLACCRQCDQADETRQRLVISWVPPPESKKVCWFAIL